MNRPDPILRHERRVLSETVGMKTVDPEAGVVNAIFDRIAAFVLRNLNNAAKTERAQKGIMKG